MAFSDAGTRIKVNSVDGVDTSGGDATHGYASIQYAANDTSLGAAGSVFEVVGTHSLSSPIDLSTHGFPSSVADPALFVSVGATSVGDGGRASLSATTSVISENTRNNLGFHGFEIRSWGTTSNCFLVNDECSFGDLIMGEFLLTPTAGWGIVCRDNSTVSNVQILDCYRGISTLDGGNISNCDVVSRGDFGMQHAGTGGSLSHNRVRMDAATGIAFRLLEDLTAVTHNIAVSIDTADAGFDVGDAGYDGNYFAYNYAQGFDVGFEFTSGALAAACFGNREYGNTTGFSGSVHAHFNNSSLSAAGLFSDHKTVKPELWNEIPGIGPRFNQPGYYRRRRVARA